MLATSNLPFSHNVFYCIIDIFIIFHPVLNMYFTPPGWLSDELVRLMTWWLWVRSPDEATFLCGVFWPLTSAEHVRKVVGGFVKKSCVSTGVRKPGNSGASPTAMIWPWLLTWRKTPIQPTNYNKICISIVFECGSQEIVIWKRIKLL